jgi:hypothetical protein
MLPTDLPPTAERRAHLFATLDRAFGWKPGDETRAHVHAVINAAIGRGWRPTEARIDTSP